jgi:MerR family mercuric resistance operon transcriptional regulator
MTRLRTGQLARAAGVRRQTLRYYEQRGLLAEPDRSPGGHRFYPATAVTRLRSIKAAQRLGFSLEEISGLLAADRGPARAIGDDGGLSAQITSRLAAVEGRIAELEDIAATLRAAQQAGCSDLTECARHPACPLPFSSA